MARKSRSRRSPAKSQQRRGRGSSSKSVAKKTAPRPGETAYQRRIRLALAKGKTLQEARGHKTREHVPRRERELREGETTYQRGEIKRFAQRQAELAEDLDPDQAIEIYRRVFKREGWAAFVEIRDELNALSRIKRQRPERRRGRRGKGPRDLSAALERATQQRNRNLARMRQLSRRYGIPMKYLHYHRKAREQR